MLRLGTMRAYGMLGRSAQVSEMQEILVLGAGKIGALISGLLGRESAITRSSSPIQDQARRTK